MNEVLMILGMALVTFGVRYPVLALFGRIPLPKPIFNGLRFVPPAVLTALIVPAMVNPSGDGLDFSLRNAYLFAGLIAA